MGKKLLPALIVAAAILAAGNHLYSKEPPQQCAFIAEVSGKAVLQREGKFYLLKGMEGAYCGETVRVMSGARVVVADCGLNTKTEIVGPAEFTVAAKGLAFKKGKAGATAKVDAELCPFFLAQSFTNPRLREVNRNGNDLPPEMLGTAVVKSVAPVRLSVFDGYLSDVRGEVYIFRSRLYRVGGDIVPEDGTQILSRGLSGFTVNSCGEGKKYRVEGAARVQLGSAETGLEPVAFLSGQAVKIEDQDPAACGLARQAIREKRQNNLKPVSLDGQPQ